MIDGDYNNLCASNLQWVTRREMVKHYNVMGIVDSKEVSKKANAASLKKNSMPVKFEYDDGSFEEFPSRAAAAKHFGVSYRIMTDVVNGIKSAEVLNP